VIANGLGGDWAELLPADISKMRAVKTASMVEEVKLDVSREKLGVR
jgi:hypothetical protein